MYNKKKVELQLAHIVRSDFQDHPFHLVATRSVNIQYSEILLGHFIDLPLSITARRVIFWWEAMGKSNQLIYHENGRDARGMIIMMNESESAMRLRKKGSLRQLLWY